MQGRETPPPPPFDLGAPGTILFDGPLSTRGQTLNKFALTLRDPENRAAFRANEDAYMARFALAPDMTALVKERDWSALLRESCHLQCILKIAGTLGLNLWHVGAHHVGVSVDEMIALCPRRVSGLPEGNP